MIGSAPDPTVTRVSPIEADVTWSQMTNKFVIRMSLKVQAVYGNAAPVVDEQHIDPRMIVSWHVTGLTPGKYYRVTTTYYAEGAAGILSNCSSSAGVNYLSSCRLFPNPLTLAAAGSTGTLTSEIVDDVGQVDFGIANGSPHSVITVNSNADFTQPYAVGVTAIGDGTTQVINQTTIASCQDTATVNVGAPIGTIQARAVEVTPADTSCAAITAVPTTGGNIDGTTLGFTPSSASQPTAQTQTGAKYVTFTNDQPDIPVYPSLH